MMHLVHFALMHFGSGIQVQRLVAVRVHLGYFCVSSFRLQVLFSEYYSISTLSSGFSIQFLTWGGGGRGPDGGGGGD